MGQNVKNVVIGVTGGIAAYKSVDIVSRLKKKDINIDVIMTEGACKFVTPLTFQTISQNAVSVDVFSEPKVWEIQHISLAKKADLILVVPATADIIGKVASGIADDLLSTTIMASKAPVVFAPSMNTNMYSNPIVQENINKLSKFGYRFIEPDKGRLACGDVGRGKLPDTKFISELVESMLYDKKDMKGKKVLVTAGPTCAHIDPVRYITNRSSGKMGYSIAEEARDRGAEVTLVSGPTQLEAPFGVKYVKVDTNKDMLESVLAEFSSQDIVIKAAAVSDYKPKMYSNEKIKKLNDGLSIEFVRDTDILKKLGQIKKNQVLVGFAAESSRLLENARAKLSKKNLDYIVANNIVSKDTGFASDDNKVTVIAKDGRKFDLEKMSKRKLSRRLFDIINEMELK